MPWGILLFRMLRRKLVSFRFSLTLITALICIFIFVFWETFASLGTTGEQDSSSVLVAKRSLDALNFRGTDQVPRLIPHMQGKSGVLNLHVWDEICGDNLQTLRHFPLFPNMPAKRALQSALSISQFGENYGFRIFGFLVPPETGVYHFQLVSSGSSELWVSKSNDPKTSELVCQVAPNEEKEDSCKTIFLKGNSSYYIEVLHRHGVHIRDDNFVVKWRPSGDDGIKFSHISSRYLRAFQDDQHVLEYDVDFHSFPEAGLPMHRKDPFSHREEVVHRQQFYNLPFIEAEVNDLFSSCPYTPSYIVRGSLRRYAGVWETHYTSIFPSDNSNITSENGFVSFGNDVLEEETAKRLVKMVTERLIKKHKGQYTFQRILNVEHNHDPKQGDRYLVELVLEETTTKIMLRFSEYLYQRQGAAELCYPHNIRWNKKAVINIIVTSGGNQARWIHHFVDNMARIYNTTKDSNFNVIIVDFHDSETKLKSALERSAIPNYMLLQNKGRFHKTLAIQHAADMVTDPNEIVFVVDLHLEIPANILDEIRKHCIQGHVTYAPLLARLSCGSTVQAPIGMWETDGYGMIGMYKSDWTKFGGMNVGEFKHAWGGEDWEMADRILMAGLEMERLKLHRLYHFYHSKKGMWVESG